MISGVVPFEEIVESIKDVTGYENMRPLRDKIRRFIFKAEEDIGAGGLIIRKLKQYTDVDGNYDLTDIILPEDFIGEYSYGALTAGVINGKILTLYDTPGPTEIDVKYMGFLLDDRGNPYTTRNHLDAVVAYSVWRLYSSRYFLGKGNLNQYREYKIEFEDYCLGARGNDAFPTEADWVDIGKIMHGGFFEALSDCGVISIFGDNHFIDGSGSISPPSVIAYPCELVDIFAAAMIDQGPIGDLPTFSGTVNGVSLVTGKIKPKFDGVINASSTVTAALIDQP